MAKSALNSFLSLAILLSGINAASAADEGLNRLIDALAQVESNNRDDAKGDYDKKTGEYRAIGCLQLWRIYVDDVNRILGQKKFSYNDRYSREKSKAMCRIYLIYYGKGKSIEAMARIHNGGPKGDKKESTIKYWNKVKKVMK